jgi:hypothetical protein
MSAAQFTPGPWVADAFAEEGDQQTRVGTNDGTPTYYHRTATIAVCQTNHEDDEPATVPRIGIVAAEANARLIAAAPELYEALVRLGTYAAAKYGNTDDELWGAITQGIVACAKARGEQ